MSFTAEPETILIATNPEDAFLAYDRNGSRTIDNGGELFGDKTIINSALGYSNQIAKNGFEALRLAI